MCVYPARSAVAEPGNLITKFVGRQLGPDTKKRTTGSYVWTSHDSRVFYFQGWFERPGAHCVCAVCGCADRIRSSQEGFLISVQNTTATKGHVLSSHLMMILPNCSFGHARCLIPVVDRPMILQAHMDDRRDNRNKDTLFSNQLSF